MFIHLLEYIRGKIILLELRRGGGSDLLDYRIIVIIECEIERDQIGLVASVSLRSQKAYTISHVVFKGLELISSALCLPR